MRRDTTAFSPTATGRGVAIGLRAAFGGGGDLGLVPAANLAGLIDAPRWCAAGACHSVPEEPGVSYLSLFGREW